MMTTLSGLSDLAFFRTSIPSISCIRISVIRRSKVLLSSTLNASSPLAARVTRYPSLVSRISRNSLMLRSSSTTRMLDVSFPDNSTSYHGHDVDSLHAPTYKRRVLALGSHLLGFHDVGVLRIKDGKVCHASFSQNSSGN